MKRWYQFQFIFPGARTGVDQADISRHLQGAGFQVVSERWVPELTFDGNIKIEHAGALRPHHDHVQSMFPSHEVRTKWRCNDPSVWDAEFPEGEE